MQALEKVVKFVFDDVCVKAFKFFKMRLISAPIIVSHDWSIPFVVMCDTSGMGLGVVLLYKREKILYLNCYASKALNPTQKIIQSVSLSCLRWYFSLRIFCPILYGTKSLSTKIIHL